MWFTRLSIRNPVLATMMMMAFIVVGLFSYQRLPVDQFPDITFPIVVVQTEYPGAAPESVESDVTRKVEEIVNTISGIDEIFSHSYQGTSVVVIKFDLSVDVGQAAQDVRDKIALIRPQLRDEVKEPRVLRYDPSDAPIFYLSVSNAPGATRSQRELTTIADQIVRKRLETVRGVGAINLVGGTKREVEIRIRPAQLEALGIGVDQVMNAIRNENQELPAGELRSSSTESVVQIKGRVLSPEAFRHIIVARRAGHPVTLGQVAEVRDGEEERESLALLDGKRALFLSVVKAQGQNTVDTVDGLVRMTEETRKLVPADVRLTVVNDTARGIRSSVKEVRSTLLEGALLTVAIVFLFLGSWRSTVITGLTLPIALVGTFGVMYMCGFTLNVITLMALSLCVGLLIDDAIVVRENIVRHNLMGKDHHAAALDGTNEIGLAVLATTLSIVAVFLPVGFMGGIIGRFFHQFGITVVAAVLISMFVSFTLDPMLSSVWHDPDLHGTADKRSWYGRTVGRLLDWFSARMDRLGDGYAGMLAWSLRHRLATAIIAVVAFFGSFALVPLIGTEFVPAADLGETQIGFTTPVGTALEVTEAKVRQVEAALREFPEVDYTYATINSGNASGRNNALVSVRLTDRRARTRTTVQLNPLIRERLASIAGITLTLVGMPDGAGGQKAIQISIQGDDLEELRRLSQEASRRLAAIPGLVDLDSSMKDDRPTIEVRVRRELASDLGIGVAQVGNALRPLLAGDAISSWRGPDDQNYDVRVRLPKDARTGLADLNALMIASSQTNADGSPRMVPLRQVAELVPTTGANQISRRDLNREVELTANTAGRSAGEVARDVKRTLDAMGWPAGYKYRFGGSTKSMNESFGYAVSALALAIIFIYMILASQFASFFQPLAIMSSLPLTLVGVFTALLLFRSTLNMFSIIGFIMLMGLVTKNAILLVDFANQARQGADGQPGLTREAALVEAARVRLRPILMTTLAMIFGMVPLAFSLGEGAEQRAPMGQTVIGGIITSSILTLVVVPVIYTYLDDFGAWLARRWRGEPRQRAAAAARPGEVAAE
ncbi:nodulation protein NolG [Cupriavidus sp. USMAA2-4]|uniref:Nodulation protein NolG n=1 Tax=Cupriavidus malaysiensis TaxID=367825 RepID=A0ABM6F6Z2_9BURK|nr:MULTISPECIES: efflux RND transporter permease subunit [Cupriavidus]AOY93033.1 nodulation protein NolG [Cupriavidus sp. USMAA2-4]AOZ00563.1 nodulation protein NolG [Cupriavidus sp. USMAHM13]AOZ07310.1 nodulation protein NolG [Cupriavidus malaysiensis]